MKKAEMHALPIIEPHSVKTLTFRESAGDMVISIHNVGPKKCYLHVGAKYITVGPKKGVKKHVR